MHTAHILRKYDPLAWGGTETAVQRLLGGLKKLGVIGDVHCPDTIAVRSDDPFRHVARALRPYRPVLPVSRISREQRDQLLAWGGNLFSFDLLWHLLRDKPVHVIHSHALNRLAGIGMLAARLRRVPFVVTLHGGALDLPASAHEQLTAPLKGGLEWGKILGWLVQSRRVLEKADALITCNPREAELLRKRHPRQRIVVEPHCVPAEKYASDCRAAALRAFPQLQGRDVLLKLARLDPVKNQRWLLAQLPRLVRENPRTLLVLAGSSTSVECETLIRDDITRLGLADHVLLTGALTSGSDELIGLLQLADTMLLSSTAETFGIVILEAWAAGTPVVSSRTSGAVSLIRDQENGCLFDLDQPESFHAALAFSRQNCESITTAARQEVRAKFSIEAAAQRMKSLYQELIDQKQTKHA